VLCWFIKRLIDGPHGGYVEGRLYLGRILDAVVLLHVFLFSRKKLACEQIKTI
jgi:hypothetical protein